MAEPTRELFKNSEDKLMYTIVTTKCTKKLTRDIRFTKNFACFELSVFLKKLVNNFLSLNEWSKKLRNNKINIKIKFHFRIIFKKKIFCIIFIPLCYYSNEINNINKKDKIIMAIE